jgi:hypothetical protein
MSDLRTSDHDGSLPLPGSVPGLAALPGLSAPTLAQDARFLALLAISGLALLTPIVSGYRSWHRPQGYHPVAQLSARVAGVTVNQRHTDVLAGSGRNRRHKRGL